MSTTNGCPKRGWAFMSRGMDYKKRFGAAWFFGLAFFTVSLFLVVFLHFGIPVQDFFKYLFGLLVFVYMPGRALFWAVGLKTSRLSVSVLSLILGLTTSTIIYKFACILRADAVFFLWVIVCAVFFVFRVVKHPPLERDFAFRVTPAGLGFVLVALAVFLMLFVDNYRNGLRHPDGSIVVNTRAYDGFLRDAVVRELSHSVPPQMPFAAGFPLSYHYGMDLFNSIFYKHLHIGVPDLNHRLSLTFFFALLILMLYLFLEELSGSKKAAVLGAFLVIFGGGGLSYLGGLIWGISQWGNVFFSFYFVNFINVNSFLPGLAILLAGFYALTRYLRSGGPVWLPMSAFLLAASLEYKMFFAFPIFGALAVSALAALIFLRDARMLRAAIWTGAFSFPLLLTSFLSNRGEIQVVFTPRFVDWIWFTLTNLKLRVLLKPWTALVHQSHVTPATVLPAIPIVALFFLGGLGLNSLALPSLWRGIGYAKKEDQVRLFLGLFTAGCVVYFFFVHVSLGGRALNFTNSYVYTLAPIVLCFFWTEKLMAFLAEKRRVWRILVVSCVIVFSVPNSVRFLWVKARSPQPMTFSGAFLEAADWLRGNSPSDAVVMSAPKTQFVCYFADRRVVLDNSAFSFVTWHLTETQAKEREEDIGRFFNDPRLSGDVLSKYHVSYVWAETDARFFGNAKDRVSAVLCYSDLGTPTVRKYLKTHRLELVFKNKDHLIYRARELPPDERTVLSSPCR